MSDFLSGYSVTSVSPASSGCFGCWNARKERDDARFEADRLGAEIARIAKERDDALADAARFLADAEALRKQRDDAITSRNTARSERADFKERAAELAKLARQLEYSRDAACDELRKLQGTAAEIAGIARERDDALAARKEAFDEGRELGHRVGIRNAESEAAKLRAERDAFMLANTVPFPPPWPGRAEAFEGLELIEGLIAGTHHDLPGTDACDQCDPRQRLARIGVLVGRLAEAARGGNPAVAKALARIAEIVTILHRSDDAAWNSLAEIGVIVGRLIAVTR